MLGKLPSSRFASIYDSLPSDAQQALVEKHLIPLLNLAGKSRAKKALAHATQLKKRHANIPVLDLKAKRMEVNALLEELHKDAKRSFVKERSQHSELLDETVQTLIDWLNDIWSIVYEHHVDFLHAHKCLLFVAGTLDHIGSGRSGCRCAFTNMYVHITLKRKSGKRIKSFDIHGAQNIEEILFFIWRDLFLSMLATGKPRLTALIPGMLEEIEDQASWSGLERVLYGGTKCPRNYEDEDYNDEDDEDESDFDEDLGGDFYDEEEAEFYDNVRGSPIAKHWSYRVSSQTSQLRKHIVNAMMVVFKANPTQKLYAALSAISSDPESVEAQLLAHLATIATSSSDAFAAALDIYALQRDAEAIVGLLNRYSHLLRPRDAPSLQSAVSLMADFQYHRLRSLHIIEKELFDTAKGVRAALLVSFSQFDHPANKDELQEIIKLRQGAAGRQERVEAWVDAISTPGSNAPNPMAFAAMMMGLPLMPGLDAPDEADPLGYLDLDPHDPDLEDLREEFRPNLKQRFEGWTDVAITITGGHGVLINVFKEVIELMPFLRANDVVEEMVGRLADRPSKHYVCDGLDALSHFTKQQRKKIINLRNSQRRSAASKTAQSTSGSSATGPSSSTTPLPAPSPGPNPYHVGLAGFPFVPSEVFPQPGNSLEDVD
ncbi:uncharacterized protein FIBRA_07143 [Fibroporia radiculosa]|uniref:Uncharacterized protein n=1 Tax=Fibroporia radiculosa TaxID=599839 RepID=J4IBN0_9APHY|nr:uncharacterized protein FIBRA_07143 [Fibroporia radiculosa]CCM04946.1 predicted protein [Fibroporia radiculosa]